MPCTFHALAENDRQNSNIAQELSDSLKAFTDNADNSLYSAVRPVPMNDFEITSRELFDFNVDELAMEGGEDGKETERMDWFSGRFKSDKQ